jgi:signal transduction histidine kinase
MLFILAALLFGGSAAWLLSLAITRNLYILTQAAQSVAEGRSDVSVAVRSHDEVGTLACAFNEMVTALGKSASAVQQEHEKRIRVEQLACAGEFAASIAHEIRNPLTAIVNAVQVVDSGPVDASEQTELRSIVMEESRRLQRILEDFLRFARMRSPRLNHTDLCQVIRHVASLLQIEAKERSNIKLSLDCTSDVVPATIDIDQIKQVIWNLVRNAIDAMPNGGHVRIAVRRHASGAEVEISDTGKGIPKQILDRIPHPFTTGRPGGTGLGLAVAGRILMMHGSELQVRSEVGRGTTIRFVLPYRNTEYSDVDDTYR